MISGISIETNSLISPKYARKSECYKGRSCNSSDIDELIESYGEVSF